MRNMTTIHPEITFGDRLRRLRMDAGLQSEEMAELLFCGRRSISHWENDNHRPSPRKLRRWAEIVAERTGYDIDAVLLFLGLAPVTDLAERRRAERRREVVDVGPRKPGQSDMWITAA